MMLSYFLYALLFFNTMVRSEFFFDEMSVIQEIEAFKEKYTGISIFFKYPHHNLLKNITRALTSAQIPFNINPLQKDIKEIFFCLQDASLLRYGIELKNYNMIKKLIVGPHIVHTLDEHNYLLLNTAIDAYLVPSPWVRKAALQEALDIASIIHTWPVGIDTEYWKPDSSEKKNLKKVLVYWKTGSKEFCDSIHAILEEYGWEPVVIRYGSYTHALYKELLHTSRFVIFISNVESQGLALAEAWAMDVPTVVWDPQYFDYRHKRYDGSSSAPYLSESTGLRWQSIEELKKILFDAPLWLKNTQPRAWVMQNQTDTHALIRLLRIIQ